MNTTETFISRVSSALGRIAKHYQASDTTRNRCKVEMGEFTGLVMLDRYGVYTFHLYFANTLLLRCIAASNFDALMTQTDDYLSTLQQALEPNERNCC